MPDKKIKQQKPKPDTEKLLLPPQNKTVALPKKSPTASETQEKKLGSGNKTKSLPAPTESTYPTDQKPSQTNIPTQNQISKKPPSNPQTPSIPTQSTPPQVWLSDKNKKTIKPETTPTTEKQEKEKPPLKQRSSKKRYLKLIFIFTLLLLTISATIITLSLSTKKEFLSPIPQNSNTNLIQSEIDSNNIQPKEIIGFLPFWNFKEEENFRYHLLTQVAFFALEIDENGNIKKLKADGTEEPGWTAYKSQKFGTIYRKAKNSGTKITLTIQAMKPDIIESIVNNPQNRKRAIDQTIEIIDQKNLDGVNIDFEYAGAPAYTTTKNFTQFIKEFNQALLLKNPHLTLSIDVFADSAAKVRIWDIPQIIEYVDHIIIMAYDFHRPSSRIAAPVAPIRGAPKLWQYDISKTLATFSKVAPLNKIILGVPYYGYEWRTTSTNRYATTYPNSGATATFKRIQSIIDENNPSFDWDEEAMSPRLIYYKNNNIQQIYYENETSLGIKYDLIHQSGLAGTAIWALGYDGSFPNLWNLLTEKFFPN